ncbi:MAG TPA: hypothetical protein VK476_04830 [Flavobacterium sp.]|nr:hypothetical protein [Flavobacterium sp.]
MLIVACGLALLSKAACGNSSFCGVDSIDNSFSIILVGESHYSFGNDEIQFQLFKELVTARKVNALLLECGMGSAYVINEYLDRGDRNLWFIEPYYTTDKNFLDSLRSFQQSLSPNDKFIVYGVDYEKNLSALSWALQDILRDAKITDSISQFSLRVRQPLTEFINDDNLEFKLRKKTLQSLDSLLYVFDNSSELFKKLLAAEYADFNALMENYRASKMLYGYNFEKSSSPLAIQREKLMYSNAIHIPKPIKLFGQFGILHVNLKEQEAWWNKRKKWYSFAAMLNNELDSPYRGKVCCIEMVYPYFEKRRAWKRTKTLGFTKIKLQQVFSTCQPGTWCIHCVKTSESEIFENKFQYLIINRVTEK